ncbi:hypothetical protein [Streptomyces sp. NPDC051909]|uniref:hypothetical protein n=1 Tax=Streptomyces sp. NPDC051909 TaxID=3154944 RepID=UPI00343E804D
MILGITAAGIAGILLLSWIGNGGLRSGSGSGSDSAYPAATHRLVLPKTLLDGRYALAEDAGLGPLVRRRRPVHLPRVRVGGRQHQRGRRGDVGRDRVRRPGIPRPHEGRPHDPRDPHRDPPSPEPTKHDTASRPTRTNPWGGVDLPCHT